MPLLEVVRDRLALPPRGRAIDARDSIADGPGFGPSIGTIVPGSFNPPSQAEPAKPWPPVGSEPPPRAPINLVGGRQSWDDQNMFGAGLPVILPPDSTQDEWRRMDLDGDRIKYMPAERLLRILVEGSPDVSRALWDFLRLMNPGWTATAFEPGTRTPSKAGQDVVDDWVRRMNKRYGSINVPIARYHFGAFLRGALFSELVMDDDGVTALDFATPDPATARFKQFVDPVLGRVWLLGQFQGGKWVDLSPFETVQYIPIDPAPASPYGRPICAPAIFSSLFLVGLMMDLRRVVAQQGYPRYDLAIVLETLRKSAPPAILQNPVDWKKWVDDTVADVQKQYNMLEPDSAFVHTDAVTVGRPTGAVSAEALGGIAPIISALERQLARALKTMPLMMGTVEGQSEANANRQWELQAVGITSVQDLSEADLSEKCTLMCEAAGVAAEVEWKFEKFRASERYRDAMTSGLEIDNATKLWLMGVISQDVLAHLTTGEPSDQKEPRFVPRTETAIDVAEAGGSGTGTGSPTATGEPAGAKPDKPPKPAGGQTEDGDEQDPNARRTDSPFKLKWPDLSAIRRRPVRDSVAAKNGRANGSTKPTWIPLGQPLAGMPNDVVYDEGDRRRLLREWDRAVPELAGMLDAEPAPPEDEDERQLAIELAAQANGHGH